MAKLKSGTRVYGNLLVDTGVDLTSVTLGTANAGFLEYDGTSFYASNSPTTSSGRGLILSPTIVRLNATRTKGTNNTLESIFDAANDTLTLQTNTLYWFRGVYLLNKQSAASSNTLNIAFTFSQASADFSCWFRSYTQTPSANTTRQGLVTSPASFQVEATASVNSASYVVEFEGWFKSNALTGGTLIPQFTQTATPNSGTTASANTWIMIQPMNAAPATTLLSGAWA